MHYFGFQIYDLFVASYRKEYYRSNFQSNKNVNFSSLLLIVRFSSIPQEVRPLFVQSLKVVFFQPGSFSFIIALLIKTLRENYSLPTIIRKLFLPRTFLTLSLANTIIFRCTSSSYLMPVIMFALLSHPPAFLELEVL